MIDHHPHSGPLAAMALGLLAITVPAQADSRTDRLKAARAQKVAKAFVTDAPWTLDYAKARKQAATEKKMVLAYFTRSYAP